MMWRKFGTYLQQKLPFYKVAALKVAALKVAALSQ